MRRWTWVFESLPWLGGGRERAPWKEAAILAALALAMRLLFLSHNGALILPDGYGRYLPIGEVFFEYWRGTLYDRPGYPFLVGSAYALFGRGLALLAIQCLLDAVTALLAWSFARRLGMNRGAFYLGLYWALHPAAILFANTVLAESLFTFLIMAAAWLFAGSRGGVTPARAAGMGLLLGFAALTRGNGTLALLAGGVALSLSQSRGPRWRPVVAFALAGLAPIAAWLPVSHAKHGIWTLSQGGGWQLLQNLAYFEIFDPQLLPEDERARYQDWRSLGALRKRLMDRKPAGTPSAAEIDSYFRELAMGSLRRNPGGYALALPRTLKLPRRFTRDVTGYAASAERWAARAAEVPQPWRAAYCRPYAESIAYNALFKLLRILWLPPYKSTLLILALIPGLWLAWKTRCAPLLLAAALPLSQALALQLMLNPIDRYYFPFEPLMVLCLAAGIAYVRRGRSTPAAAMNTAWGDIDARPDHRR